MTLTSLILQYANLSFVPEQYRWLVPIALVLIGVLMLFRASDTWKFLIAAIGAIASYYGVTYFASKYYLAFMVAHGLPTYTIPLIAAVVGSVLLTAFAPFALSAVAGYASFMYLQAHFTLSTAILVAVIIGGIVYYLYNRIIKIVARITGALILFIGLIMMHVAGSYATVISVVLLLISMIWLVKKKKIIALYQSWKASKKQGKSKIPKPHSKKIKVEGVKARMGIIHKLGKNAMKIVPHRKVAETVQPTTETITHVKADGTVVTETREKKQ